MFSLEKEQETSADDISIALIHTKSNNSKLFPARGLRVHYENQTDNQGIEHAISISYHQEDVQASPTLSSKTSQKERVIGFLGREGQKTNAEIAEFLGKFTDQVRAYMHSGTKKKTPAWKQFGDKWGLLERNRSEAVTRNSYVRERNHRETLKGSLPLGITPPDNSKEEEGVTRDISNNSHPKKVVQQLGLNTGQVTNVR